MEGSAPLQGGKSIVEVAKEHGILYRKRMHFEVWHAVVSVVKSKRPSLGNNQA